MKVKEDYFTENTEFYLSPEHKEKLLAVARKEHLTLSNFLRRLVLKEIDKVAGEEQ